MNITVSTIFFFIFLIILLIIRNYWLTISDNKIMKRKEKFVEAVNFTVCLFIERNLAFNLLN
jgi:hypothetical protein